MSPSSLSKRSLFPMNVIPGAALIPGLVSARSTRDGDREGGARWGMLARSPRTNQDPRRSRGWGSWFLFSGRSAAWRGLHGRAEPAGVSGRTGLSGLSSWVSAVGDRRASVISFLRPPGPGRAHPPG